jgi:hypothetical protein
MCAQDEEDSSATHDRGPKVGFMDAEEQYFAVWKCLLLPHATGGDDAGAKAVSLEQTARAGRWVVVLASGGHFAAAVFDWNDSKRKRGAPATVVANKTFHRCVHSPSARRSLMEAREDTLHSLVFIQ